MFCRLYCKYLTRFYVGRKERKNRPLIAALNKKIKKFQPDWKQQGVN